MDADVDLTMDSIGPSSAPPSCGDSQDDERQQT